MVFDVSTIIIMLQNYSNELKILTRLEYGKKLVLYKEQLYIDSYSFLDLASENIKYDICNIVDFIENRFFRYFEYLLLMENIYNDERNNISNEYEHQKCYSNFIISLFHEYIEDLNKLISKFNKIHEIYNHDTYMEDALTRIIEQYTKLINTLDKEK